MQDSVAKEEHLGKNGWSLTPNGKNSSLEVDSDQSEACLDDF